MLKIFVAKGSCSLASHIALEEAGADFSAVKLDLSKGAQRAEDYLAINPKGRVPALATDSGVITETPAILTFIAQSFPDAGLAPLGDAFAFAKLQSFMSYLASTVHVAHAHAYRGSRWADDPAAIASMKAKVPQTMGDCFELIETTMFEGPWVMGDRYTVADPYLFTIANWLEGDGVDISRFPKVADHRQRMAEREAVERVMEWLGA